MVNIDDGHFDWIEHIKLEEVLELDIDTDKLIRVQIDFKMQIQITLLKLIIDYF